MRRADAKARRAAASVSDLWGVRRQSGVNNAAVAAVGKKEGKNDEHKPVA